MPTHILLAASYVELGRMDEARAEVAEILRISPDFRSGSKSRGPYKDQAVPKRMVAALRKAGLK